jgi:hypothetical protein
LLAEYSAEQGLVRWMSELMICRDFPAIQLGVELNFEQAADLSAASAVVPAAAQPLRSTKKSMCRPLPDERSVS